MKIEPLYDRVVILPKKNHELNVSGIIIPQTSNDKSCIGKVECVGDGTTFDGKTSMLVKKDDNVLYSKFAGTEFKMNDIDYIMIRQTDILGIIKEGE